MSSKKKMRVQMKRWARSEQRLPKLQLFPSVWGVNVRRAGAGICKATALFSFL